MPDAENILAQRFKRRLAAEGATSPEGVLEQRFQRRQQGLPTQDVSGEFSLLSERPTPAPYVERRPKRSFWEALNEARNPIGDIPKTISNIGQTLASIPKQKDLLNVIGALGLAGQETIGLTPAGWAMKAASPVFEYGESAMLAPVVGAATHPEQGLSGMVEPLKESLSGRNLYNALDIIMGARPGEEPQPWEQLKGGVADLAVMSLLPVHAAGKGLKALGERSRIVPSERPVPAPSASPIVPEKPVYVIPPEQAERFTARPSVVMPRASEFALPSAAPEIGRFANLGKEPLALPAPSLAGERVAPEMKRSPEITQKYNNYVNLLSDHGVEPEDVLTPAEKIKMVQSMKDVFPQELYASLNRASRDIPRRLRLGDAPEAVAEKYKIPEPWQPKSLLDAPEHLSEEHWDWLKQKIERNEPIARPEWMSEDQARAINEDPPQASSMLRDSESYLQKIEAKRLSDEAIWKAVPESMKKAGPETPLLTRVIGKDAQGQYTINMPRKNAFNVRPDMEDILSAIPGDTTAAKLKRLRSPENPKFANRNAIDEAIDEAVGQGLIPGGISSAEKMLRFGEMWRQELESKMPQNKRAALIEQYRPQVETKLKERVPEYEKAAQLRDIAAFVDRGGKIEVTVPEPAGPPVPGEGLVWQEKMPVTDLPPTNPEILRQGRAKIAGWPGSEPAQSVRERLERMTGRGSSERSVQPQIFNPWQKEPLRLQSAVRQSEVLSPTMPAGSLPKPEITPLKREGILERPRESFLSVNEIMKEKARRTAFHASGEPVSMTGMLPDRSNGAELTAERRSAAGLPEKSDAEYPVFSSREEAAKSGIFPLGADMRWGNNWVFNPARGGYAPNPKLLSNQALNRVISWQDRQTRKPPEQAMRDLNSNAQNPATVEGRKAILEQYDAAKVVAQGIYEGTSATSWRGAMDSTKAVERFVGKIFGKDAGTGAGKLGREMFVDIDSAFNAMGDPGRRIAALLHQVRDAREMGTGRIVSQLNKLIEWRGGDRAQIARDFETVRKHLDISQERPGGPLPERLRPLRDFMVEYFAQVAKDAEAMDLEIRLSDGTKVPWRARQNYWPHMHDAEKLADPRNREKIIDEIIAKATRDMESNPDNIREPVTRYEAGKILDERIKQNGERIASNLEISRERDFDFGRLSAIEEFLHYVQQVERRKAEMRFYGKQDANVKNLFRELGGIGEDQEFAENAFDAIIGKRTESEKLMHKAVQGAMDVTSISSLGLSQILNSTQPFFNLMTGNFKSFSRGVLQVIRDLKVSSRGLELRGESIDYAERIGAIGEGVIESMLNGIGSGKQKGLFGIDWLTAKNFLQKTGFIPVEIWNRVVSANVGKEYVQDLGRRYLAAIDRDPQMKSRKTQFLKMQLEDLRIDANVLRDLGRLTEDQIDLAAKRFTDMSQHRTDTMDLPLLWRTNPWVRLAVQFKSFGNKQSQIMRKYAISTFQHGDLAAKAKVVAALGAAALVGEAAGTVRRAVSGRPSMVEEYGPLGALVEGMAWVGATGVASDYVKSLRYRGGLAAAVVGPTLSKSMEVAEGGIRDLGEMWRQKQPLLPVYTASRAARQIPIIGWPLSNAIKSGGGGIFAGSEKKQEPSY